MNELIEELKTVTSMRYYIGRLCNLYLAVKQFEESDNAAEVDKDIQKELTSKILNDLNH